jgi:nitroreductase
MMLAAQSLGLGSCWVHRAKETFEKPEWKQWLISIGITEEVEGIGNLILGYPDKASPVKEVNEGRVFFVR